MTERVDIANLALSWLGEQPISSLDDESDRALQMKINYEKARDATLEAHDWTFAIKRFIPAMNAVPPVWGASFAFDVPSDILRVIGCWPNDTRTSGIPAPIDSLEQIDWQMENNQIVTDVEVVFAKGIRRVLQEGKFSPNFVHAFAAMLASLTALNLTASASIQANMDALYNEMILKAKSRDGLQGRSRRIRQRSFQKAR